MHPIRTRLGRSNQSWFVQELIRKYTQRSFWFTAIIQPHIELAVSIDNSEADFDVRERLVLLLGDVLDVQLVHLRAFGRSVLTSSAVNLFVIWPALPSTVN